MSSLPAAAFRSVNYAAAIFDCHPQHIRNQISLGTFPIPTVKVGGKRMIPAVALERFIGEKLAEAGIIQAPEPELEQSLPAVQAELAPPKRRGAPFKKPRGAQ